MTIMSINFLFTYVCLLVVSALGVDFDQFIDTDFRPSDDPGYVWHCLSALFQWLTFVNFSFYFIVLIPEFKTIDWKSLIQTNQITNDLMLESNLN